MDQLSAQEGPQPNSSVTEANNAAPTNPEVVKTNEPVTAPFQGPTHLSESAHEAHAQVSAEEARRAQEIIDRLNQVSGEKPSQSPTVETPQPETSPILAETTTKPLSPETAPVQPEASVEVTSPTPKSEQLVAPNQIPTNVVEVPKASPATSEDTSAQNPPIAARESPLSEPLSELEALRDAQLAQRGEELKAA